jgi:TonB-dependent receptor
MNTLNYGDNITFISGLRVEIEDNDYKSKFTPGKLTGFPTPSGIIKDTTAAYTETIWLPNFHLSVRPVEFMLLRFAAYKAIARPDFNHRLEYYNARDGGGFTTLAIGNPKLLAAKAWNFEVNTSFFSNKIGLFSISAFYKEIQDMFHLVDGIRVDRAEILDSLGITWQSPFAATQVYNLTYPYNSKKPTKVWGIEVEHQANLFFLPGLLQNIVLSYNFSLVRSETYIASSRTIEWRDSVEIFTGYWVPRDNSKIELQEVKRKLEGQPEFFGNFAIGYDIGGFSGRVSVFYQGEFNSSFSGDGRSDRVVNSFTRWDLALKYKYDEHLSFLFNLNNFTNIEESTSQVNRIDNWNLLNTSERYDLTADFGVRITL